MIEPLQLARGVRLAREDELPRPRDAALARLAGANITTGFTRRSNAEDVFSDYFEINAHARHTWPLFVALTTELLPEVAAPLVAFKDEEPEFGPYTDKAAAINVFAPYAERLVNDGFIEFGAMFSSQGKTTEVLVKSHKYFCVWTNAPARTEEVLSRFELELVPALQFIDEFPCVTESSPEDSPRHYVVIQAIRQAFDQLQRR